MLDVCTFNEKLVSFYLHLRCILSCHLTDPPSIPSERKLTQVILFLLQRQEFELLKIGPLGVDCRSNQILFFRQFSLSEGKQNPSSILKSTNAVLSHFFGNYFFRKLEHKHRKFVDYCKILLNMVF